MGKFKKKNEGVHKKPIFRLNFLSFFFMFDFEQFPVYQRAEEYYALVLKIVARPKIDKNIKDQLKRASLSIVLNIAEGAGKYSKQDKKNFYVVAKGSVNECVALMRILRMEEVISEEVYNNA